MKQIFDGASNELSACERCGHSPQKKGHNLNQ